MPTFRWNALRAFSVSDPNSPSAPYFGRLYVVQSSKFSEMITRIMNAYYNGHISNDEVIKELLEAAELIAKAHQAGDALGLTQ